MHCDLEKQASQLAALAHPARLKIVQQLAKENACCVKYLVCCVDLAQSTVSQHLKTLLNAGLVTYQTRQQSSWYEINRQEFSKLSVDLSDMFNACCDHCELPSEMPTNESKKL